MAQRSTCCPQKGLAPQRQERPEGQRQPCKCRVRNQFGKGGVRLAFSAVFETLVEVSDFREAVLPLRAHFLADRVWVLMPLECRAESIRPCFNSLSLKLRIKEDKVFSVLSTFLMYSSDS